MPIATFVAKKGRYTIDKYRFEPGMSLTVTPEVAAVLLKDSKFVVDGVMGFDEGSLSPADLQAQSVNQTRAKAPALPALGFRDKKSAIAFAKNHFGIDLNEAVALKILNRQIVDAWNEKYGAKAQDAAKPGDEGFDTGAGVPV